MPDFSTLKAGYPKDADYPQRTFDILALSRVIDGKLYAEIKNSFGEEKNKAGEYLPLSERRPSARTRFCQTVVTDSVSLLFDEGHFPQVNCENEDTRKALAAIIKEACLNRVMIEAAVRGSVGSICIHFRVLKARIFFDVVQTTAYLTPAWDPDAPDTLKSVTERYKITGEALKAAGYSIADADLQTDFWFQRMWDANAENWYLPLKVLDAKEGKEPQLDASRTVKHLLGFCPMVWVKNLPCGKNEIDGAPTFPDEAIDTQIEADYLLSQGGRGLKYQSDPVLHIKEPAFSEQGAVVKGAANALITSAEGDAKLLEINGDAAASVMEWVKSLRELTLEGMGGNRSSPDKLSAAQSGRAMELMNQSLIWLADKLRISYGEGALLNLLCMVVRASSRYSLKDKKGREIAPMKETDDISLKWPAWYAPTYADKSTQATTLDTLRGGGLMSQETAVASLAEVYDIEDIKAELTKIKADPPPPNSVAAKPDKSPLSAADD